MTKLHSIDDVYDPNTEIWTIHGIKISDCVFETMAKSRTVLLLYDSNEKTFTVIDNENQRTV